jgi:hypothetical protein
MGDRIPMHRRAVPGRLTVAARAWPGFAAARAAGAAPIRAGAASIPAGAASIPPGAVPIRAGAAFPAGWAATPVTPRALPGRLACLLLTPLARRVIRWRAERRVLRELLAPYEVGGYQPSPPTWRRLRDQARTLTRP